MKNFMVNKILLDTWAWLALKDKKEKKHEQVIRFCEDIVKKKKKIYTTDFILAETITLLFKRMNRESALSALKDIEESIEGSYIELVRIEAKRFNEGLKLRKKLSDKPDISFTDLTSMVVMKEMNIKHVVTGDTHFQYVGMDFKIIP